MPDACEVKQLIDQYEAIRRRMKNRIEELAKSYEHSQPLNQYFSLLQNDEELERLDDELCELEGLLPDSYQFDAQQDAF